MSERIMTLFGEEIIPQPVKPEGKSRAKKASKEKNDETQEQIKENEADQPQQTQVIELHPEVQELPEKTTAIEESEIDQPPPQVTELQPEARELPEKTTTIKEKKADLPHNWIPDIQYYSIEDLEKKPLLAEEISEPVKEHEEKAIVAKEKKAKKANLPDDWEGDKQYYSIGEVATLFNVKTSHIRFWTNEFKLKVRTTRKGDRLFTAEQIKELRAIHHLVKERGFTLSGAKAKMKTQNKIDVETIDLKQSLQQLRSKLLIIKNQLK